MHREWKRRSLTLDAIASDKWQTVWDDLTVDVGEPLVENELLEALEDKAAAAASVPPKVHVAATRGTRGDRAERVAEQRRRVFRSYWDRSFLDKRVIKWYLDWWAHGAAYATPWCDLYNRDGSLKPPEERFPYLIRLDPRVTFPLAHNSQGRLTAVVNTRMRSLADLKNEYGPDHPGVRLLEFRWQRANPERRLGVVEETWFFDEDQWAVAVSARTTPAWVDAYRYVASYGEPAGRIDEWLMPPTSHGLNWCPVAEGKRESWDDQYRSPLDSVIPRLKVAQNLMARYLEDVSDSIFGPVVMEGIINPEDFGPNARLLGDGSGNARVEFPRKPTNFEARQATVDQLAMSRRQAKHPEQRSGEAGASIVSARGTNALMGSFNDELRTAHTDIAHLLQWGNVLTANYDEVHCFGRKTVEGFETGAAWVETYDAASLFRGDFRNEVTYGSATGLDRQNLMSMMALGRNMQAISRRTFMTETGLVEDVLAEERDMLIENMSTALEGILVSQAMSGNAVPLQLLVDAVDDDSKSIRQAVFEVARKMQLIPANGPAGTSPQPDPLREVASLEAGGTGVADGMSDMGASMRRAMPDGVARELVQSAPQSAPGRTGR